MSDNMQLWDAVRTPDPAATKAFTRGGGFKGTATNAVYLIQRATELWGPMGGKWGVEIIDDRVIEGAPLLGKDGAVIGRELLHVIRINLRHPAGYVHAGVYTLFMLPLFPWFLALLIGVTHLFIDTRGPVHWWMRNIKRVSSGAYATTGFVESAVDQAFHVVVLAAAALAAYWLTL